MRSSRWSPSLPGLLLLVVAWASFGGRIVDDAFISLTYAAQLLEGHGLVFHPALPATEGYSNLLWTLLLALGMALGGSGPFVAVALGLLFAGATLVVVTGKLGGWRGALVGMVTALSPIYGFWAGQGLEGSLFSFLLTLGVLNLEHPLSWLAFGLLGVTRVEGVFYGMVPLAAGALAHYQGERKFRWWGPAVWLAPPVLQLLFRVAFYGSVVPATVVAKVKTGSDALDFGIRWLSRIADLEPLVALAALGAILTFALQVARKRTFSEGWVVVTILGILSYSVAVGGDWMLNLRWLQPAIPLVWYLAARMIPGRGFVALAGIGMILAARMGIQEGVGPVRPRNWNSVLDTLRGGPEPVGVHPAHLFVLEELRPTDATLIPDVGQLAWLTGNPVLDPQGLNWRTVAEAIHHEQARDPVYFEKIQEIQKEVRELSPRVVAIPLSRKGAYGPVGEALLGSVQVSAPSWFLEEWKVWRELPQGEGVLRYYLRNNLDAPLTPEEQLARYDFALSRLPNVAPLQARRVALLRTLGHAAEADSIRLDGRFRQRVEVWTRDTDLSHPPAK